MIVRLMRVNVMARRHKFSLSCKHLSSSCSG